MGSSVYHFHIGEDGKVHVQLRFEDDAGNVGHSFQEYDAGQDLGGIPYTDIKRAGSGEFVFKEDGTVAIRDAATDDH